VVYVSAAADVSFVMVDGRIILQNGVFKTIDEEKIRTEATHRAKRLVNSGKGNEQ